MKKLTALLFSIVALAFIAAIYTTTSTSENIDNQATALLSPVVGPSIFNADQKSETLPLPPLQQKDPTVNIKELSTSNDYRSFILNKIKRDGNGDLVYATAALDFCTSILTKKTTPSFGSAQLMALSEAKALCGNSTYKDFMREFARSVALNESSKDELFKLMQTLSPNSGIVKGDLQTENLSSRKNYIKHALTSGDPMLILGRHGVNLSIIKTPSNFPEVEDMAIFFNNEWLTGKDITNYIAATQLLQCEFGFSCNNNRDWVLLTNCIEQNACYTNRTDLFEATIYKNNPSTKNRVEYFKTTLKKAILEGNPNVFVPHP